MQPPVQIERLPAPHVLRRSGEPPKDPIGKRELPPVPLQDTPRLGQGTAGDQDIDIAARVRSGGAVQAHLQIGSLKQEHGNSRRRELPGESPALGLRPQCQRHADGAGVSLRSDLGVTHR